METLILSTASIMNGTFTIPVETGENEMFGPYVGMSFKKWQATPELAQSPLRLLVVSTAEGAEKTMVGFTTHLLNGDDEDPTDWLFYVEIDDLRFAVMPSQFNKNPDYPGLTEIVAEVPNGILIDKLMAASNTEGKFNCHISISMIELADLYDELEYEEDDEDNPFAFDIDEEDEDDDDFGDLKPEEYADEEDENDEPVNEEKPAFTVMTTEKGPEKELITDEEEANVAVFGNSKPENAPATMDESPKEGSVMPVQEDDGLFVKGRAEAPDPAKPASNPFIKVNYISREEQSPTKKEQPKPQQPPKKPNIQDNSKKYRPAPMEKTGMKDNTNKKKLPTTKGTDLFGGW